MLNMGHTTVVVKTLMAQQQYSGELPPLRRGWVRVTLPNIPNPWHDLLRGVPPNEYTVVKASDWCKAAAAGKWKHVRYNIWDFQKPGDAMLFTLTWG